MGKELWDSRLRVDDEAEQSIDFKHHKWEFPITVKVLTVEECLCVRVFNIQYLKGRTEKKLMKSEITSRHRITMLSSQDCMISLLGGCASGSVTHVLIRLRTETRTQTQTQTTKAITNMRRFVCRHGFGSRCLCSLSACCRILVVVVRAQMHMPNPTQTGTLPDII